ncbi:MAG: metallophosphoesterase [Candidatus Hydrogenedentota bacterium]
MINKSAAGFTSRTFLALVASGVVLLAFILASECLMLPYALETVGRVLYRAAFFIILPARLIVGMFIPQQSHHWPVEHFVISCMAAPFLYWMGWHGGWYLWKRFRHRVGEVFDRPLPTRPSELSRRQFLARSTAGVVGVAWSGIGGYASMVAPQRLQIAEYTMAIRDLPKAFEGLRIVQISDTHYGPYNSMPYLLDAAEKANALDGDLILFTGDYTHHTPRSVDPGIAMLDHFEARLGRVAVLGNHDHWEGAEACKAAFRRLNVPLIDNGRLFLTPDGVQSQPIPGESICLAGVGDLWCDEVNLGAALEAVPSGMPRLVLSHNPDVAEEMDATHRVDLMFSGHTHGGQVQVAGLGPAIVPSRYGTKYRGGLCQGPHCPVVVSHGIGVAFLPVRLGVPPDIGLIILKRA